MRKLFAGLLALLCLIHAAWAAPASMPYDPSLSLRWQLLTPGQRQVFDVLYEAIVRGDTELIFEAPVRYDDIDPAMSVLQLDCPELCRVGYDYSILYYRNRPDEAYGVRLTYCLADDAPALLLRRAELLLDGLPDDPASRVKAIHDSLCLLVDYSPTGNAHNAYGALAEGQAVCDGSTKALLLLLRLSGIPCSMVTGTVPAGGTGESHSWCMLQLDGRFTQIDIVWDDTPDGIGYSCFLVSDEQLPDHKRDADSARLPACD